MLGKVKMKSWTSALGTWASNWKQGTFRSNGSVNGHSSPSVFWLKTTMDIKEQEAKEIKSKYSYEDAMGTQWESEEQRARYAQLRKEYKELRAKIGASAT